MLRAQADIDASPAYAMHNAVDPYQADYHPTQADPASGQQRNPRRKWEEAEMKVVLEECA